MRHPAYRFTKWGEDLYGGALQCALSNAPARILSGPYDTGKTYSCLHMMNIYAMEYPGARLTFAHKTRDQVDSVIVPTFERVLGYKPTERRRSESKRFVIKAGGDKAKYFELTFTNKKSIMLSPQRSTGDRQIFGWQQRHHTLTT